MQTIGSYQLSDSDYDFIVDTFDRLPDIVDETPLSVQDFNLMRRLRMLNAKLKRKRTPQTPQNTKQ